MTNEQAKQEAIEKAWGDNYNLVRDRLYGSWYMLKLNETPGTFGFKDIEVQKTSSGGFRPISLVGIHDNNGWIRIEPDGSNMPESGTYHFYDIRSKVSDGENCYLYENTTERKKQFMYLFTHYKPKVTHPLPIY